MKSSKKQAVERSKEVEAIVLRLKTFMKVTGLSQNQFSEMCGFASGALSKIIIESRAFRIDKLINIFNAFPDLNPDWLLFGTEPMLYSQIVATNQAPEALAKEAPETLAHNLLELTQHNIRLSTRIEALNKEIALLKSQMDADE